MKDGRNVKLIEIYSGNSCDVAILMTLLEDFGIQSFEKDNTGGTFSELTTIPGLTGTKTIIISQNDVKMCNEVVNEFKENLK